MLRALFVNRVSGERAGRAARSRCRPRATCSSRWTRPGAASCRRSSSRYAWRREFTQAGNPRALSQRDLLRPARLRRRRGRGDLLRQAARRADARRSRDARGHAAVAVALQPDHQSAAGARSAAPTCCVACTSSASSTTRQADAASKEVVSARRTRALVRRRSAVCRRDGAARAARRASATPAQRRGLQGLHDDRRPAADAPRTARVRIGLIEYDRRHGWRGAARQGRAHRQARTPEELGGAARRILARRHARSRRSSCRWPRRRRGCS